MSTLSMIKLHVEYSMAKYIYFLNWAWFISHFPYTNSLIICCGSRHYTLAWLHMIHGIASSCPSLVVSVLQFWNSIPDKHSQSCECNLDWFRINLSICPSIIFTAYLPRSWTRLETFWADFKWEVGYTLSISPHQGRAVFTYSYTNIYKCHVLIKHCTVTCVLCKIKKNLESAIQNPEMTNVHHKFWLKIALKKILYTSQSILIL